jgi:putative oxidoreductase
MSTDKPAETRVHDTTTRHDLGLLLLRLGAGAFMAFSHGLPKLLAFSEKAAHFPDPLHIGSVPSFVLASGAEFFGSLLLVVGLFTRPAALSLVITMLVAGLIQHAPDPWAKKELPLLFGTAFATLALAGAGGFSLDAWWARRRVKAQPTSAASTSSDAPRSTANV